MAQPDNYKTQADGSQYYIKIDGMEQYAVDGNLGEYYAKDANGTEYYARDDLGVQYFARDKNYNQHYAHKTSTSEFVSHNAVHIVKIPIFPTNAKGSQFYAKDVNRDQIYPSPPSFARDEKGDPFYAKNSKSEYYFKLNNVEIPIVMGGAGVYAMDISNNEIYPKNSVGNDYLLENSDGTLRYARTADDVEIFPRTADGSEFIPSPYPDGTFRYPKDEDGNSVYPHDVDGNEVYELTDENGRVVFIKDSKSNEIYAKMFNSYGDLTEYYPDTGDFALNSAGEPKYASNLVDEFIYPIDEESNEYYLKHGDDDYLPRYLTRYAKRADGTEIYPRHVKRGFTFDYLGETLGYARDNQNKLYYPMDSNGNEMFFDAVKLPDTYPITSDDRIIIPQDAYSKPFLLAHVQSDISLRQAKDKIYRPHEKVGRDYYTDVRSTRKTRFKKKEVASTGYSIFKNVFFYIFLIIFVILFIGYQIIQFAYVVPARGVIS